MAVICAQLVRGGRFVRAEPWFEPGAPISVAQPKRHLADVGKLVLVQGTRDIGRVVEALGSVDDVHAAMRGLLAEEGLLDDIGDRGVTPAWLADAVTEPVSEPIDEGREDLRGQLVVTIDPPAAKDHDGALALEPAAVGGDHAWVLWVHIADVSAYVRAGSELDMRALDRAMSAYVPGSVAPMLPHELSSDLCSLRPGVDRRCVSVRAEIAEDGEVLRARFGRTLIRSARRLTYDEVDDALCDRRRIDPVIDQLLGDLAALAAVLRGRRLRRGALDMALPEVEYEIGEVHVEAARLAMQSRSHQLVEECMLVANDAVGMRLAQAHAPGIWRVHDHPDPESIDLLMRTFEALGIPTPSVPDSFSGAEAAQIAAAAASTAQRYADTAQRGRRTFAPRVLRALQQASYRAAPGPHSGLATRNYAHFTSPIRRYPDLVVHRSLLQLIGSDDDEAAAVDLAQVAEHVSEAERDLQRLERRAHRIAGAYHLHRHLHVDGAAGEQEDGSWRGEISGMIGAGMFVSFGDVYEGFVPARTLSTDERYELDEQGLAMVGTSSGHRFRLGDAIDVWVDRVDRSRGKVDLRRVGGRIDTRASTGARVDPRGPSEGGSNGSGKGRGSGKGSGKGSGDGSGISRGRGRGRGTLRGR